MIINSSLVDYDTSNDIDLCSITKFYQTRSLTGKRDAYVEWLYKSFLCVYMSIDILI